MHKRSGCILMLAGMLLMLSALSLYLYNRHEDARAGELSENMLDGLRAIIHERQAGEGEQPAGSEGAEELEPEMPVKEIEGYGYVGYLDVPVLELELPVMSEWDYERLQIAPCRQFGSSRTDDLVIAAHNYEKHFGKLAQLEKGDELLFTDMDGIENKYQVALVTTLAPTEVETVEGSEHALVLYTCTYGGKTRVAVFCDRQDEAVSKGIAIK